CFSADDTKLYTSADGVISQYDISSGDSLIIENSKIIVGSMGSLRHLKRAKNGKIYFLSSQNALGVINQPNLSGTACGFVPDVVSPLSGTRFSHGLPNVVPVIRKDTFLTRQLQAAGCFASRVSVSARDTSTGWDYVWNTGATEMATIVDTPGVYWVS